MALPSQVRILHPPLNDASEFVRDEGCRWFRESICERILLATAPFSTGRLKQGRGVGIGSDRVNFCRELS